MRRTAMFAFAATAVVAIGCGSTSTTGGSSEPAAQKPITTVAAGQPMTLSEGLFGTKDTEATITVSNPRVYKAKNSLDKPDAGQYYAVDVSVSVSKGKFSLGWHSFKLVAADGTVYDAKFQLDPGHLDANDITVGQKSAGRVTFDIPSGAEAGAKVGLKRLFENADAGYWTL